MKKFLVLQSPNINTATAFEEFFTENPDTHPQYTYSVNEAIIYLINNKVDIIICPDKINGQCTLPFMRLAKGVRSNCDILLIKSPDTDNDKMESISAIVDCILPNNKTSKLKLLLSEFSQYMRPFTQIRLT